MSKSLIKLIDSSLLPAAIMIVGKVFGIYLVAKAFGFEWALQNSADSFISLKPIFAEKDIIIVSSYSDLIMLLFVLMGLSFTLFRALYLHASHIDPRFVAKLATNNLLDLVKDSFDVYHESSMWLLFTWITTLAIFLNVLLERTYIWILVISMLCCFGFTLILLRDVGKEIALSRKRIATENFA
ncbi:hypothetical protein JW796_01340 [Candidatus Dojkabacteria bacterium]|nr:hypothetical protein [Candidatus Dojkabacteria bacterium]